MMTRRANVMLLVVSFTALIFGAVSTILQSDRNACQARVNEASAQAQLARAAAADQDRMSDRAETAATATLIQAVFTSTTPDQVRRAYAAYAQTMVQIGKARAGAEAQRQANPLPAPPSETCG